LILELAEYEVGMGDEEFEFQCLTEDSELEDIVFT
jgi:hypothetical protein